MRTYGRSPTNSGPTWVEVTTDTNGFNDAVYLTTLCQVLLGNLNESPFYGNYGLPAEQSILTQIYPDFYIAMTQRQFSQYFAALVISRQPRAPNSRDLVYNVAATTQQGVALNRSMPIPT